MDSRSLSSGYIDFSGYIDVSSAHSFILNNISITIINTDVCQHVMFLEKRRITRFGRKVPPYILNYVPKSQC